MTIYTELLRAALDDGEADGRRQMSDDELVGQWLERRRAIEAARHGVAHRGPAAVRVAELLACDVLLVELCRRLGVDEQLTDPSSGPRERERVERAVDAALVVS